MSQLIAVLVALPPALVLLAAALLPALEASAFVGLVVPGETAVFVAGVIASGGQLPLWTVMAAATLGAVVGDQVGYSLGRHFGPQLLRRLPRRLRDGGQIERAAALIRRQGILAVLLGRWTALLRALVPGLAGVSGLARRPFLVANIVGGTTWAVAIAAIGYGAGAAYERVAHTVDHASALTLGVVVLVVVVVALVRRHRRRRPESASR